jgi:alkylation response protein AidB-like acyl-CoA dehydrogenase
LNFLELKNVALIPTEEQTMLLESARDFLTTEGSISQLRQLRDTEDATGFSLALWKQFADMGFSGVLVPEAHGGMGLGYVEVGIVMDQIGRNLSATPFLASNVVATAALLHGGSRAQQAFWLPRLVSGDAIATLAVEEHTKHRPSHLALSATPTAHGFILHGSKTFVLECHVADLLIVAARRAGEPGDYEGITLFLVDAKADGVDIERTVMADAHNAGRIRFSHVKVNSEAVLGPVDGGWATLGIALNAGRAAAAAELLGLADEAFARTVQYLKERKQFGRLIGEFQALQHRAAQIYCELEITRAAVAKALSQLDADPSNADESVSIAKARAGRTATLAVQEAVQMHGGMGMTDEFDLGFFMKRARVLQELFGDANFHLNQLAQSRGY